MITNINYNNDHDNNITHDDNGDNHDDNGTDDNDDNGTIIMVIMV